MKEFLLAKGITVPDITGIHECYEMTQRNEAFVFTVNISVPHIEPLLMNFCFELAEPCFFILEIPTNVQDEEQLRLQETDPYHCDVYYCDGLSKQDLYAIIKKYGELFIQDGMVCFGIASHTTREELFVGKYKIIQIFTGSEARCKKLLHEMRIPLEENIKTVWENFSQENPGTTSTITMNGKNIYDALEELKKQGFYFAERREQ